MLEIAAPTADIAIIGMACIFPGAPDLASYWRNIVERVDAVGEPPDDWRADLFFDPETTDCDRVYCKRGGYLRDLAAFNPLEYGVMPSSIDGGEPDHFLALRVAHEALTDAGYNGPAGRVFDGDRVEVILGRGVYINRAFTSLVQHSLIVDQTLRLLRQLHPEHGEDELQQIRAELKRSLPAFNAEIAPGLVPNILSGRIANRLDLKGPNFTIDAACASSLIAVERASQDLLAGRCDMAVVGGVQCSTPAPIHMIFCQLNALSRQGTIRPFASDADGTVLGEGLGMMVLKRASDAQRDGDRVYAVIKAVGSASDGRALGLLAPRADGQELALRRAYDVANVDPSSIGLIEAHGTGTAVGDQTEAETLARVFAGANGAPSCALGSVKSMIGHLLPAAGIAGIIKASLALYYKVLPPTLHCEQPNPKLGLENTSLYLNTETRAWLHGLPTPRRAGVNAFGFGGINAHAILEEFTPGSSGASPDGSPGWDSEVVILRASSRGQLLEVCRILIDFLAGRGAQSADLASVAYTFNCADDREGYEGGSRQGLGMALVATSLEDLKGKLNRSLDRVADSACKTINDISGVYFSSEGLGRSGKVAFLFPGEGSQYLHMMGDLCLRLPAIRERFDLVDRAFAKHVRKLLPSQVIFPPPLPNDPKTLEGQERRLEAMDFAAEAVFAASQGMLALLTELGICPQAVVGHSGGETSALLASGVIRPQDDARLIENIIEINALYEHLRDDGVVPSGRAIAVNALEREIVLTTIQELGLDVHIAIDNCPHQVVICGKAADIDTVTARLRNLGALCVPLAFQRPYHTAAFEPYCARIAPFYERLEIASGEVPVYSAAAARLFPADPFEIRRLAVLQPALPVRFRETVEAMHDDGVRVFVEVGPGGKLTSFVADTLRGRRHMAIASNLPRVSGIRQLNCLLGQLAVNDVGMRLEPLYERRGARRLSLDATPVGENIGHQTTESKLIPLEMGLSYLHLAGRAKPPAQRVADLPTVPIEPRDDRMFAEVSADALDSALPRHAGSMGYEGSIDSAMQGYFASMDRFLTVQQDVMQGYLDVAPPLTGRDPRKSEDGAGEEYREEPLGVDLSPSPKLKGGPRTFSMIGKIESNRAGTLVAVREFDTNQDLFLNDHALGGRVSITDASLTGLPLMPLTMTIELMAEAAAALIPGRTVVELRDIRASNWLAFDHGKATLRVTAVLQPEEESATVVQVRVHLVNDTLVPEVRLHSASGGSVAKHTEVAECSVILADRRPDPPPAAVHLRLTQRSKWRPEQLYRDHMFHGPCFRGVEAIETWAENGSRAVLRVLPRSSLFAAEQNPIFLFDPILLDAAGQIVGYWAAEYLSRGFNVFPYRVKSLQFFGPVMAEGQSVSCQAEIRLIGDSQIHANLEIAAPDGRIVMRALGWEDLRVEFPDAFYRMCISPRGVTLSARQALPMRHDDDLGDTICFTLARQSLPSFGASGAIWLRALAAVVLSKREREIWHGLKYPEARRIEWLVGRCCVKDAVKSLLNDGGAQELLHADIEILTDENGRPKVTEGRVNDLRPAISIAHSDGLAVALASREPGISVGIDVERIDMRRDGFEDVALTEQERRLIAQAAGQPLSSEAKRDDKHHENALRLWCAKEAVGKALGFGLTAGPGSVVVDAFDDASGTARLSVSGNLAHRIPDLSELGLVAHTYRAGDAILAFCLYRRKANATT
jgi:acyl transferase domain-containing protein/phosphopantetheinyl transferase